MASGRLALCFQRLACLAALLVAAAAQGAVDATPEPIQWTPHPVAVSPEPAKWTPQPAPEAAEWTPEPVKWTPESTPSAPKWTPEPVQWTPEPTPSAPKWTPEPVKWTPEPTAEAARGTPEPVAPTPEPAKWTPEPAADGAEPSDAAPSHPRFALDYWQPKPPYPLPLLESAGGMLRTPDGRHLLMVAGGYIDNADLLTTAKAYVLDVSKEDAEWQRVADMPRHLTHCAQAIVGDRMFLCGGFLASAPGRSVGQCYVFSYSLNEWSHLPKLPLAVGGGGLVYIKKQNALLFSSGMIRKQDEWDGEDSTHTYMLKLHDQQAGWTRMSDIPAARNHMSAVSVNGRYFFVGGQKRADEEHGNSRLVHEYVVGADEWVERAQLPVPLGHIAASTIRYGKGFLTVAGITDGRTPVNSVYYYSVRDDEWTWVGTFRRKVQSAVCGVARDALYCTTGRGAPGDADESWWRPLALK